MKKHLSKRLYTIISFIVCNIYLTGCVLNIDQKKANKMLTNDYCAIPIQSEINPSKTSIKELDKINPDLLRRIGIENSELIQSIGLIEPLIKLSISESSTVNLNKENKTEALMDVNQKLMLARDIIGEITGELDCEAVRATRIRDYLASLGTKRNNNLTIAAIFSGAVTGLAPLVIKNQNPQNAVVIAGSALSAALGVAVLTNNKKKVEFLHERNLLGEIWNTPGDRKYLPDFIWTMLTSKIDQSANSISDLQRIRNRWSKLELSGMDKKQEKVLFGQGGTYTQDELSTRISLLNELSTEIRLLNIRMTKLSLILNDRK
ncbi:hypothetical protein [Pedobacter jamesrossensis]|uniref:Lipoprotein n=1 Tax=Pedobacter jamesrossensis TaxID=1908238 RepID=A0ABV8NJN3_9SPHI